MTANQLKWFLPDHPVPTRIWRGPFRGARIVMNPRCSLRKVFGLYEHELNGWLEAALRRVNRVLDVGANDGYFTFGCAAAFRRLGINGDIIGFEPQARHVQLLRESIAAQVSPKQRVEIVHALVGRVVEGDVTTLDALPMTVRHDTLIKIDVEGAEMDVIAGGISWIKASNLFVIEVHQESFLNELKSIFAKHNHKLVQIEHRPLPLLGAETRNQNNWWLVSELDIAR